MRFTRLLPGGLALSVVLAACGPGSSPTAAPPDGSQAPGSGPPAAVEQVLRIPLGGEPATLDPNRASDAISITVLNQLVRPLVYFDTDLNTVSEGGLAESWDLSADGTEVTFHLKDGITYSNGDPIVAADFVYSWKRLIDPRTAADYSYVLLDVAGGADVYGADAEDDAAVDAALETLGVAAPDDSTFVVTLERPASYFVSIATLWVTAPLQEGFEFGEADSYVSSGPFVMSDWQHGASISLAPNDAWTAGPASNLTAIEMPIIEDPLQTLAAYENDEVDLAAVPSAEVERIRADEVLSQQVVQGDRLSLEYYGFDMRAESLFGQSQNLRYAFSQALDKQSLIDVVRNGIGTVAGSAVPPGMPGHQADIGLGFDADAATAAFDEALTELGLADASAIDIQLGFNADADHEPTIEFFQEQWRTNLGVENIEPVALEWSSYLTRLNEDPFDIFRLGWGADYPHPNNFLTDLFTCTSGNNNMKYCNEQFDEMMAQAAVEPDLDAQVAIYNEAQQMLVDDAPVIFVSWGQRFTLVKPWIEGMQITPADPTTGSYFYTNVTVSEH
jgi:oligopeptide transport system substrate-binding protein